LDISVNNTTDQGYTLVIMRFYLLL
jgi:hypothetical protein